MQSDGISADTKISQTSMVTATMATQPAVVADQPDSVITPLYDSLEFFPSDAIEQFLSTPVLIQEVNNGTGIGTPFNPFLVWFNELSINNKLRSYAFIRHDLRIRIEVAASSVTFGRTWFRYNPGSLTIPPVSRTVATEISHLGLGCDVDPATSSTVEFVIPWHCEYVFYSTSAQAQIANIGEIIPYHIVPWVSAMSATAVVSTMNVYASAENIRLSVKNVGFQSKKSETPKSSSGVVSGPASIVADAAGIIKKIPFLSPLASAVEIGARGVASIASFFGFSVPLIVEATKMIPVAQQDMAVTACATVVPSLNLDAHAETSLDVAMIGTKGDDCMSIEHVAKRFSFVNSFTWSETQVNGTVLFKMPVMPGYTAAATTTSAIDLSCVGFYQSMFQFWRGALKVQFEPVVTSAHRGKLIFAWLPFNTTYGDPSSLLNNAPCVVYDIASGTFLDLTVPYMSNYQYVQTGIYNTTQGTLGTFAANGWLHVYVWQRLCVPVSTVNGTITVLVRLAAGDDFSCAAPTVDWIKHLDDQQFVSNPYISAMPPVTGKTTSLYTGTEGAGYDFRKLTFQSATVARPLEPVQASLHGSIGSSHVAEKLQMGEAVGSLRSLVKRWCCMYSVSFAAGTTTLREMTFPVHPMRYMNLVAPMYGVGTVTGIIPVGENYMGYLYLAYRGWKGGVRVAWQGTTSQALTFSRARGGFDHTFYAAPTNAQLQNNADNDINGCNIITDGTATRFAQVPYYGSGLYIPRKPVDEMGDTTTKGECIVLSLWSPAPVQLNGRVFMAAAEDWTPVYFVGPPRMWGRTKEVTGAALIAEEEEMRRLDESPEIDSDEEYQRWKREHPIKISGSGMPL